MVHDQPPFSGFRLFVRLLGVLQVQESRPGISGGQGCGLRMANFTKGGGGCG